MHGPRLSPCSAAALAPPPAHAAAPSRCRSRHSCACNSCRSFTRCDAVMARFGQQQPHRRCSQWAELLLVCHLEQLRHLPGVSDLVASFLLILLCTHLYTRCPDASVAAPRPATLRRCATSALRCASQAQAPA